MNTARFKLFMIAIVSYATIVTFFTFRLFYRATLLFSNNVNEEWNAAHALRYFDGGPLYPPLDSLIINNYPPLSFLITNLVMHAIHDPILAGRLVSATAFVSTPP